MVNICHVQRYLAHLWLLLTFAESDVGIALQSHAHVGFSEREQEPMCCSVILRIPAAH
jgi:hypothetical protein